MGNVTGVKFDPLYTKYWVNLEKRYRPGLRRMKTIRYSRGITFGTATQALLYAARWARKAEKLIDIPKKTKMSK